MNFRTYIIFLPLCAYAGDNVVRSHIASQAELPDASIENPQPAQATNRCIKQKQCSKKQQWAVKGGVVLIALSALASAAYLFPKLIPQQDSFMKYCSSNALLRNDRCYIPRIDYCGKCEDQLGYWLNALPQDVHDIDQLSAYFDKELQPVCGAVSLCAQASQDDCIPSMQSESPNLEKIKRKLRNCHD